MNIKIIKVGYLETNCYILKKDNYEIVIDPGDEIEKILPHINNLESILITHHHSDHIGALNKLLEKYPVPCLEYKNLEEKEYQIKDFKFKVIFTSGHTDDSVSYYFFEDDNMFTGDFLFKETIGRTDLKTGDFKKMLESIKKIKKYKQNINIYPGHGDKTNLGYEMKYNIYLK